MNRPILGVVVTLLIGVVIAVLSAGCRSLPTDTGEAMTFRFDFDEGPLGFVAGFADYPPAHEEISELTSGHRALPAPLESQSGLFISGVNRGDDLFMFFKGSMDGLTPGASYAVEVSVEIATSTPAGCFGVGGAPGESVWIKGGDPLFSAAGCFDGFRGRTPATWDWFGSSRVGRRHNEQIDERELCEIQVLMTQLRCSADVRQAVRSYLEASQGVAAETQIARMLELVPSGMSDSTLALRCSLIKDAIRVWRATSEGSAREQPGIRQLAGMLELDDWDYECGRVNRVEQSSQAPHADAPDSTLPSSHPGGARPIRSRIPVLLVGGVPRVRRVLQFR